jgi:hypothetical protein
VERINTVEAVAPGQLDERVLVFDVLPAERADREHARRLHQIRIAIILFMQDARSSVLAARGNSYS